MPDIQWTNDLDEACRRAEQEDRLIVLDFFSPT